MSYSILSVGLQSLMSYIITSQADPSRLIYPHLLWSPVVSLLHQGASISQATTPFN